MTDPAIARSLELQRRGFRVVVQADKDGVTVYVGRRGTPISRDSQSDGGDVRARLLRGRAESESAVAVR